jgi:ATP-binding cassette, subfamily C (CFTR/MRP), member 1
MDDGDKTWIGERGGNLSGGQKQRIALARAAYSRAKLYVLDSPLSAVDMYTCQHIFKFCIEDLMIGCGGTVVLATHQTELFPMSDHLVVMEGGKTVYNGKYTYDGVKHMFPTLSDDAKTVEAEAEVLAEHEMVNKQDHSTLPKCTKALEGDDMYPNQSKKPLQSTKKPLQSTKKPQQSVSLPTSTASKEYKESVYVWYTKQMGVGKFTTATLIFVVAQVFRVYSDAWVSTWTKRKYTEQGFTTDAFYAGIYFMLVVVFLCFAFLRVFYWFYAGKGAANKIHDSSFGAALKAPMHFFHVTPIGKLLSYFSRDVDVIDDVLVDNYLMLQIFLWILLMALGVVAYNLPLFLALVGALAVVYVYIVSVYIVTSAPLKKEMGKSQSEVVAHTAETLSGLAVVRAFNAQKRFFGDNLKFQARSTVVTFSIANLSLWLAFRVDIIGSLLVLGCCLLALFDSSMDASVAGLIVSNSFQILLFFSIMSRTMGELHDNMKAVDEARTMSDLEAEHEPAKVVETPTVWPSKGEIKFEGVVMPYLPNMPPVLKGINFSVREGEKIGVVGRTGAGKSSLIVALYRLADISEGRIHVDSVDCSTVSLNKLRSSMAIIPQEPVMFGGTLRTNLDPFNQRTDAELMDVLHKCLLGPVVEADEYGLQAKVEVMGSNYSLGTQQLICLARAMLNPSRILLLDEATAALDSNTNAAVQEVLKAHFSDRTIFTIAHRLDTIIDSDRILTMNAGVVAEYAHPHELLSNPDSIFHELCMNAGRAQFEVLAARARSNFHAGNDGDEFSC